jgi:hypothetical protein
MPSARIRRRQRPSRGVPDVASIPTGHGHAGYPCRPEVHAQALRWISV